MSKDETSRFIFDEEDVEFTKDGTAVDELYVPAGATPPPERN